LCDGDVELTILHLLNPLLSKRLNSLADGTNTKTSKSIANNDNQDDDEEVGDNDDDSLTSLNFGDNEKGHGYFFHDDEGSHDGL
jgi:hypothetical protein